MTNVGILVSGGGTNLQAIIDAVAAGKLPLCRLCVVISSKKTAYAITRAEEAGIAVESIEKKQFSTVDEYDEALIAALETYQVDLVVMAGYMHIAGKRLTDVYANRIINVHPSLIPSFCGKGYYGLNPHIKALEYGVKVTGATTHFVSLEPDSGPIIMQKAIAIQNEDTPESLQQRVMREVEWQILPESIRLFSEDRIRIKGRIVTIRPADK